MCYRLVLFCNLLHAIEAWRTETFRIILINSIRLHIPRPSTRLGRPTVRISSYRYFIMPWRSLSSVECFEERKQRLKAGDR